MAASIQDTGLISLYTRSDNTLVFWMDARGAEPRVEHAAVTAREIASAVEELRTQFAPVNINFRRPERTATLSRVRALGEKLLGPISDALAGVSRVVVASHGDLHALPLHAMAPASAEPLGISHAVTYVPSLSFFQSLLDRKPAGASFQLPSLCLATAAEEDADPIRESFLIAPRSFATATGGRFEGGIDASIANFRKHAVTAELIYLSCHGQADPKDSLESSLLLSNGAKLPARTLLGPSKHRLSVRDILGARIQAPLVVLDACTSGVQTISPGDEPSGFPTAFLLAGSAAVIAANWSVEQNCARDFMLAFVEEWTADAVMVGDAMQRTYRRLRKLWPHPFHWAAFSLFGDNRLLFPGRYVNGPTLRTDQ